MNREFFAGKKVLVMGLGRFGGGLDTARFASRAGAKVIVTDLANAEQLGDSISRLKKSPNIELHLAGHSANDFKQADIVIVNPAVAPDNEFLQLAQQNSKLLASQIGIFFELCPATIIGITGANGKSTTAALTAHLLRAGLARRGFKYRQVWLSGNIGNQPLLTIVDQIAPDDLVVLELSSFQIEQLAQIKKAPQVALLTNLTPNHLDRYDTFEDYCAAKENIFKFQDRDGDIPPVLFFNAEDEIGMKWFAKYKQEGDRSCMKFSAGDVGQEVREAFPLPGRANLSNLAAAIAVAGYFGVDDERIKACLPEFKPLPHRLELVARIDGVTWYNDSKATTPEGAITALEAFDEPEIIIAGGYDKHVPFDELGKKIARKAKAAVLLGQTAEKIAASIRKSLRQEKRRSNLNKPDTKIEIVNSLAEAVECARQIAVSGDIVLLSPACASYDMFDNFEHRARQFCELVKQIRD